MKYLPSQIKQWYFPFNWKVEDLWDLEGEEHFYEVDSLSWHLDERLWSSVKGKGMLFDVSPKEVLKTPDKYPLHIERIEKSDLGHPIIVTEYQGKEIIMDGLHRLAKAFEKNEKTIKIKKIHENKVKSIAIYV